MRPRSRRSPSRSAPPRGAILLVVLVLVAILSIANLTYLDWTFAERQAVDAATRHAQAHAAADSAVEMTRAYLAQGMATVDQDGGVYDNPERFRAALVSDGVAAELRVRASVLAPVWGTYRQEGGRYGLEDESGRLNLNTLLVAETREPDSGRDQLLALPGMTEAIADSILDWIDEDDSARSQGAELDYYASQTPGCEPANGPLASIEQLLLVKGVTPELLYGPDQDRDFQATPQEQASVEFETVDNSDGALNGGWASMLTLRSAESNLTAEGEAKININDDDLEQLHSEIESLLGLDVANYVVAYRQGGPEEQPDEALAGPEQPQELGGEEAGPGGGGPQDQVKSAAEVTIDFTQPATTKVHSLLDLVGVRARVVEQDQVSGETLVESPYSEQSGNLGQDLLELYQTLTTTDAVSIPGRVNINSASRAVLAGLPGMPPEAVEGILANRDPSAGTTRPDRQQPTWLLSEGYVDLEEMRAIAPYVTGQGAVFRAQVLGGYEAGGPTARLEVVIDTTESPPRVVERRDLSPLGAGHDPEAVFGAQAPAGGS